MCVIAHAATTLNKKKCGWTQHSFSYFLIAVTKLKGAIPLTTFSNCVLEFCTTATLTFLSETIMLICSSKSCIPQDLFLEHGNNYSLISTCQQACKDLSNRVQWLESAYSVGVLWNCGTTTKGRKSGVSLQATYCLFGVKIFFVFSFFISQVVCN